jgi:hypothetical protein
VNPLRAAETSSPRRLVQVGNFVVSYDAESDFGKVNVWDLDGMLVKSVDVVDLQHVFLEDEVVIVVEQVGEPRRFKLVD